MPGAAHGRSVGLCLVIAWCPLDWLWLYRPEKPARQSTHRKALSPPMSLLRRPGRCKL